MIDLNSPNRKILREGSHLKSHMGAIGIHDSLGEIQLKSNNVT